MTFTLGISFFIQSTNHWTQILHDDQEIVFYTFWIQIEERTARNISIIKWLRTESLQVIISSKVKTWDATILQIWSMSIWVWAGYMLQCTDYLYRMLWRYYVNSICNLRSSKLQYLCLTVMHQVCTRNSCIHSAIISSQDSVAIRRHRTILQSILRCMSSSV